MKTIDIDDTGLNLGKPEELNVITTMKDEAERSTNKSFFEQGAIKLDKMQDYYITLREHAYKDKTLNKDQQDYLVYKDIGEYETKALKQVDDMETQEREVLKAYTNKLYVNDISNHWSQFTEKMMQSPLINDKVLGDPSKFIDNPSLAPVVAMFVEAKLYSDNENRSLPGLLNHKHTPKAVAGVERAELNLTRLEHARKGIMKQARLLRITPARYEKLNASAKLREANKKMGF